MEDSVSRIAGKIVKNKLKMKFPLSYKALNTIFLNASEPALAELQGEYTVDILSFLPSLKRLNHKKVIYARSNKFIGHNMLFGKTWGRFSVSESTVKEAGYLKTIQFSYALEENFFLTKNIRDYIRCIEDNTLYIGKFYYRIYERSMFIGYFSLKKIK